MKPVTYLTEMRTMVFNGTLEIVLISWLILFTSWANFHYRLLKPFHFGPCAFTAAPVPEASMSGI